jgi:hypothetical protein
MLQRVDFIKKPAFATIVGRFLGNMHKGGELYLALIVYSDFGIFIMHTVMHCLGEDTMTFETHIFGAN